MGIGICNQIDQSSVNTAALGVIHKWSGSRTRIFNIKHGFIESLDRVTAMTFNFSSICTVIKSISR